MEEDDDAHMADAVEETDSEMATETIMTTKNDGVGENIDPAISQRTEISSVAKIHHQQQPFSPIGDREVLRNHDGNHGHTINTHHNRTSLSAILERTHNPGLAATKRRKVSFKVGFTGDVFEIQHWNDFGVQDIKQDLFYSDADYERFRASEQKRYHKLVTKRIQSMVQEKMQPIINEAVAKGATLEDIEKMIPKTHEEMVAYLGGEENIPGATAAFGGCLEDQGARTIRASRSSIEASKLGSYRASEGTPDGPRTIRSSRSSLVTAENGSSGGGGVSVTDAAAVATAELMMVTGEEGTGEEASSPAMEPASLSH